MAKQNKKQQDDSTFWFVAIALMFVGLTPIGLAMILWKLFFQKDTKPSKSVSGTPRQTPLGARTTAGAYVKTGRSIADPLHTLNKKVKSRVTLSGILSAFFSLALVSSCVQAMIWLPSDPLYFLQDIWVPFCCALGSIAFLLTSLSRRKQLRRFRSYLAMIGTRTQIPVSTLAGAMNRSPDKVREDLADMLDLGIFPIGFLDYSGDCLVLSTEGVADPAPRKAERTPDKKSGEDTILAEIRAVNDAITHEKLSAQIDRIGLITAKILDYQKSHPEKGPALHSFLSYYLPTTLKILRAYAQLETQDVKGENITATMERIESMMDKVVEGFEKQLDQLFLGDTMDITTDVEVLEQMLKKDGLSGSGTTLQL